MAVAPGVKVYRAPGRVNLIGEHTDYNLGFVLPIALDMASTITAAPLKKRELRAHSAQIGAEAGWPLESIATLKPQGNWTDYVIGVAQELLALGLELPAVRLSIDSAVPVGSGLSSSAALEVSTALALLDGRPMEKLELARLCQRAERNFVGMPCGIMDQFISVFGQAGAAVKIDCRDLSWEAVQLPPRAELFAVNTMVKHELGRSAYPERVKQCQAALAHFAGKASLREVTLGDLERTAAQIPEVPLARARHVVLEDWRVEQFLEASRAGDLERMGRLFVESHRSLQHDYEVSCAELDFLVDAALKLPGVYGARMTGGGFGGCTVNLVDASAAADFPAAIQAAYKEKYGIEATVYHTKPGAGAAEVC